MTTELKDKPGAGAPGDRKLTITGDKDAQTPAPDFSKGGTQ